MNLRINPIVIDDLKAIRDFISEDNPEMAIKTINMIYENFKTVQLFPNIGSDLSKRVRFKTTYRYVINGNYIILYQIQNDSVEIYRVINRYQDISSILF